MKILEGLMKGLIMWQYGLIIQGLNYMANALLDVFNMDLTYFQANAPITTDIINIVTATGWALLIGNLAFQAMKVMISGIGFDGEDPKILFTRTFVFSFLLVANRQICNIGLGLTSTVIELLRIPSVVSINTPNESHFGYTEYSWLLVVIIGLILIWQIIKFFFEIGERYVVLAVLTIMAPLAFGMGGSKNTENIFKEWCKMYASMCVMMIMNVVFLKLILSAMDGIPSGTAVIPWLIFIVAIVSVGRKVDEIVSRIGLNPAKTGDPLGKGVPITVSMAVARGLGKAVGASFGAKGQAASNVAQAARNATRNPFPIGGASNTSNNNATANNYNASNNNNSSPSATRPNTQGSQTGTNTATVNNSSQGGATSVNNISANQGATSTASNAVNSTAATANNGTNTTHQSSLPTRPPMNRGGANSTTNRNNSNSTNASSSNSNTSTTSQGARTTGAVVQPTANSISSGSSTSSSNQTTTSARPNSQPNQSNSSSIYSQATGAGAVPSASYSSVQTSSSQGQSSQTSSVSSESRASQGATTTHRPPTTPQASRPVLGGGAVSGIDRSSANNAQSRPPTAVEQSTVKAATYSTNQSSVPSNNSIPAPHSTNQNSNATSSRPSTSSTHTVQSSSYSSNQSRNSSTTSSTTKNSISSKSPQQKNTAKSNRPPHKPSSQAKPLNNGEQSRGGSFRNEPPTKK